MILVSSGGSSSSSMMPYMKMKGQLEDAVKGMGFERCVILQPGMLLGHRCVSNIPSDSPQTRTVWCRSGRREGGGDVELLD
jgi:hypothetical protein